MEYTPRDEYIFEANPPAGEAFEVQISPRALRLRINGRGVEEIHVCSQSEQFGARIRIKDRLRKRVWLARSGDRGGAEEIRRRFRRQPYQYKQGDPDAILLCRPAHRDQVGVGVV